MRCELLQKPNGDGLLRYAAATGGLPHLGLVGVRLVTYTNSLRIYVYVYIYIYESML